MGKIYSCQLSKIELEQARREGTAAREALQKAANKEFAIMAANGVVDIVSAEGRFSVESARDTLARNIENFLAFMSKI